MLHKKLAGLTPARTTTGVTGVIASTGAAGAAGAAGVLRSFARILGSTGTAQAFAALITTKIGVIVGCIPPTPGSLCFPILMCFPLRSFHRSSHEFQKLFPGSFMPRVTSFEC